MTDQATPATAQAPATRVLRVLLVDDHPLFREGLAAAIDLDDAFTVVAQADSGEQALTEADRTTPDLTVMDLGLPGLSGIETTRRLLGTHPDTKVVVMTMSEDDDNLLAAMRAGARGYLLKGAVREEILRALHTVGQGGAVFSPTWPGACPASSPPSAALPPKRRSPLSPAENAKSSTCSQQA